MVISVKASLFMDRRNLLKQISIGAGAAWPLDSLMIGAEAEPRLKFAVQQYSFNHQLENGELTILDNPKTVVEGTGIKALEYDRGDGVK